MVQGIERPKFRSGEGPNKPYGGNIADKPLTQTLYRLAASQGFESQKSLARALGSTQSLISEWFRGKSFPSPELFGRLLIILNLTDEEREPLVELYSQKLASQELRRKNADHRLKASKKMIRPSDNPMGKWFESLCEEKGFTLSQGSDKLGSSTLRLRRRRFSLGDLNLIRQNAKDAFDLSGEQMVNLSKTIEKEIQYRRENGSRLQSGSNGLRVIEEQRKLSYRTWNGEQAGSELGVSRQTIGNWRRELNLPLLLTEKHMELLRARKRRLGNIY